MFKLERASFWLSFQGQLGIYTQTSKQASKQTNKQTDKDTTQHTTHNTQHTTHNTQTPVSLYPTNLPQATPAPPKKRPVALDALAPPPRHRSRELLPGAKAQELQGLPQLQAVEEKVLRLPTNRDPDALYTSLQLVNGGFPLFWCGKSHVSNGQHVSVEEPGQKSPTFLGEVRTSCSWVLRQPTHELIRGVPQKNKFVLIFLSYPSTPQIIRFAVFAPLLLLHSLVGPYL